MSAEHARVGRANRRRGSLAEKGALEFVQEFFPKAARTRLGEVGGDMTVAGVGDRSIEVTSSDWKRIAMKCDQSAADALAAGVEDWCVLKSRRRMPGQPRKWFWISDAAKELALRVELDRLRADIDLGQDRYDKGYSAGYQAGRRERSGGFDARPN